MDIENKPFVYRKQLIITGKYYVGKHKGNNINYKGSGVEWKKDYKLYVKNPKKDVITEILEYCKLDDLKEREEYWLNYFNVVNDPSYYNITDRSGGTKGHNDETKKIISLKRTGQYVKPVLQYDLEGNFIKEWPNIISAEKFLKIIGISTACRKNNNTKVGNFQWKYKIFNFPDKIEKYINNNWISILQYSLDGKFIKEWDCIDKATKKYGDSIQQCCINKQKTAHGFIWKIKQNNFPLEINPYVKNKIIRSENFLIKLSKPINQYDLNMNLIQEFESMAQAEKITKIKQYNISNCCRNKQKTAGKYIWKFKNN